MITYVVDDLFQSPAQVLVNPVNTVGSMSRGLSHRFKRLYPDMYEQYRQLCLSGRFDIGHLWLYKTPHKWVLNLPTKADWRDASRREYVERALLAFVMTYADREITSVSLPVLGAGLDGLDWEDEVRPLMERYLDPLPIHTYIHLYEPGNRFAKAPEFDRIRNWLHSVPRYPDFEVLWADLLAILNRRSGLTSLDGKVNFEVRLMLDDQGLVFYALDSPVGSCSRAALADLWACLQNKGYVHPGDLLDITPVPADLLISLMTQLDYLRPINMARVNHPRQIGMVLTPSLSKGSSSIEVA